MAKTKVAAEPKIAKAKKEAKYRVEFDVNEEKSKFNGNDLEAILRQYEAPQIITTICYIRVESGKAKVERMIPAKHFRRLFYENETGLELLASQLNDELGTR